MTKAKKPTTLKDLEDPMLADLIAIAKRHLLRDLTVRNIDREDFSEVHAASLRDALIAAYKAGQASAKKK